MNFYTWGCSALSCNALTKYALKLLYLRLMSECVLLGSESFWRKSVVLQRGELGQMGSTMVYMGLDVRRKCICICHQAAKVVCSGRGVGI